MPYYLDAPSISVTFTYDSTDVTHDSEGIVEDIQCQVQRPVQFFDGGSASTRFVIWGPLQGQAACTKLQFSHTSDAGTALELTTDDVLPDPGFAFSITFGSTTVASFSECIGQYDGPGITNYGGTVFYQGTTTIRIFDPNITDFASAYTPV